MARAALDSASRHTAGRSAMALAYMHSALAQGLLAAREREAALPLLIQADQLWVQAGGATEPLALGARASYALTLAQLGRLDESERVFAGIVAMPLPSANKASIDGRLAGLRSLQGRHAEAVALARASVEGLKLHAWKTLRAQSLATLGSALLHADRPGEAIGPLEQAVALYRQAQLYESPDCADAAAALARAQPLKVRLP